MLCYIGLWSITLVLTVNSFNVSRAEIAEKYGEEIQVLSIYKNCKLP